MLGGDMGAAANYGVRLTQPPAYIVTWLAVIQTHVLERAGKIGLSVVSAPNHGPHAPLSSQSAR